MTYSDVVFMMNCCDILFNGYSDKDFNVRAKWKDGTPAHTIKKLYVMNTYNLTKDSIPVMTLRKCGLKNAVDELLWIYQKKTSDLSQLHSHIWDSWDIGDGTIGKAYGYQIGKLSKYKNPDGTISMRDQIDQVIWDLKNNPGSRSIITNTYCHEDLSEMGLRPCAYMMTFNVTKNQDGQLVLNGMLNQRSQDMLTANNWNVVQYSVLIQMLAQVTGMIPGQFTHVIADMHIYDRHIPIIHQMIRNFYNNLYNNCTPYEKEKLQNYKVPVDLYENNSRVIKEMHLLKELSFLVRDNPRIFPKSSPTFWINPEIKDFYDFTVDDIKLTNYVYDDFNSVIEVAI